jgi:hypothetical protein
MESGFRQVSPGTAEREGLEPGVEAVTRVFSDFGLDPFAYVASSDGSREKRWLIYLLCSVFSKDNGHALHYGLSSSLIERAAMRLGKVLRARSRFMMNPSRAALLTHVLLNAVAGGRFRQNLSLVAKALSRDNACFDKHILLQRAPQCSADGDVVFCDECPDATIRNGELLPHCLVDRIPAGRG